MTSEDKFNETMAQIKKNALRIQTESQEFGVRSKHGYHRGIENNGYRVIEASAYSRVFVDIVNKRISNHEELLLCLKEIKSHLSLSILVESAITCDQSQWSTTVKMYKKEGFRRAVLDIMDMIAELEQ